MDSIPDFSKPFDESNVSLLFDDGKRLYFSRGVLAFHSPVFSRMFLGDWKEGNDDAVPLPQKSSDDFHTVLRLLSVHSEELITDCNIANLLSLADEYEIRTLSIYGGIYMLKHWKSDRKRFEAVELALQFHVQNVIKALLPAVVCSSLADLKLAAEVVSTSVYAAIMQMRAVRQNELFKKADLLLKCYPVCVVQARLFVCDWCGRMGKACASGHCEVSSERPSRCQRCKSSATVASLPSRCSHCNLDQVGEGKLCVCGINCDDWLADEVVKVLLKKN